MTRLLGLTPSIAHPPRERPRARAVPAGTARHHCRGSRVVLPLWGLSAYFLPQKLLYVVYCRKKTLNNRQSRRVNQQSRSWRGLASRCFRHRAAADASSATGIVPLCKLANLVGSGHFLALA